MVKKNFMRVGTDLIRQLSETFYPNTKSIFREVGVNGRDAGAENINIDIGKTQVTIEDDGEGMTGEGLTKYFYISHSEKKKKQFIQVKGLNRKIIGKYGIGKLSMHQLGGKIIIETWRNGEFHTANFDFDEMLKKKFIDEIALDVKGPFKANENSHGTKITILRLKKNISEIMLRRALQKTMPIKPDFKIVLNKKPLKSYKLAGQHHQISEEHPILGQINGKIIFTDTNLGADEAGVHIRVHGVSVNENPRIMNFMQLTSSMGRYNKFYMDVNVDGLDDTMLSNRAGFIEDKEKYQAFLKWCKTILSRHFKFEAKRKKDERSDAERTVIPKVVAGILKEKFKDLEEAQGVFGVWTDTGDKIGTKIPEADEKPKDGTGTTNPPKLTVPTKKGTKHKEKKLDKDKLGNKNFTVKGVRFTVDLADLGPGGVECEFENEKKRILINQAHPLYLESRKLDNLEYHCLKSAIVCMSVVFAKNMSDFQEVYTDLCQDKKTIN